MSSREDSPILPRISEENAEADERTSRAGEHAGEHETPLRPGWHRALPEHVPRPTYWPAALALGLTLLAWGVVTTFAISAMGLILFTIALIGWIGEMRHEH